MNDNRGSWYLLTGFIIGIVLGLAYVWVLRPIEYEDTSPASLRAEYKERYRALIAAAYVANGDLVRAKARLELLKDPDLFQALSNQAQRSLAEGNSPDEARALGLLSVALGQGAGPLVVPTPVTETLPAPLDSPTPAPATPTIESSPTIPPVIPPTDTELPPSATPSPSPDITATQQSSPEATLTPGPTRIPSPTPGAPFVLQSRQLDCEQNLEQPLIQVQTLDASGQPVPGLEVIVSWEGNEERFFTGLKPEMGLGYADFVMTSEITYTIRLAKGGQAASDLSATRCENREAESAWGTWLLTFVQPR